MENELGRKITKDFAPLRAKTYSYLTVNNVGNFQEIIKNS